MKGPAIFLAQFAGTAPPFDKLETMARWAAGLGYVGVQVPTDPALFDLEKAAKSQTYCDEIAGKLADADIVISELSTHLQGQLVAVHGVSMAAAAGGARRSGLRRARTPLAPDPRRVRGSRRRRLLRDSPRRGPARWRDVRALPRLGRRPQAREHPVRPEPLRAAATRLRGVHRSLHERIKAFHVKDTEFRPNGRSGVYGGYQSWIDRPGRFRSPGDGQIDFTRIFSKFAQYGYDGWAVLEWECCLKHPEDGAREGAPFIRSQMIRTTKAFDDFAASSADPKVHARILGLDE